MFVSNTTYPIKQSICFIFRVRLTLNAKKLFRKPRAFGDNRAKMFSACYFTLLMPIYSLLMSPHNFSIMLLQRIERSATTTISSFGK